MKNKNQKGITLIALVITIIVLIILAGISINLLFGDNGIINKAKNAGEVSEKADIEEKLKLAYSSVVIDKYVDGITDLSSRLQVELQKSFPSNDVSVTLNGNGSYQVIIQGKGTYTIGEGGKAEEVRLAGFYKNNGEYVSWQELIERNLILVEDSALKIDENRIFNNVIVSDAKDWIGTLVIDDSITTIEHYSLNFLPGMKKIIIPATTISIAPSFFETVLYNVDGVKYQTKINSFEINENNPNYKTVNGVIYSKDMKKIIAVPHTTTGVFTIPNGVEVIERYAFMETAISGVIIPNTVTTINNFAFCMCKNLTELNLPNSVTSIEFNGMTYGSTRLMNINMESGNSVYKSIDGVLYSTNGKLLYEFPKGRTGEYIVPSGVTTIKQYAFNTALIENIVFPETVTRIEPAGCAAPNFLHVVLPNSIQRIDNVAFGKYDDNDNPSGCTDVTYKGVTYTSRSALLSALQSEGVTADAASFGYANLSE